MVSYDPLRSLNDQGVRQVAYLLTGYGRGLNLVDAPDMATDLFIGREEELQTMEQILQPQVVSRERRVLILGGMGGVGKTQLAINYAKRYRDFYSSIHWLNAKSAGSLDDGIRRLASSVLPHANMDKIDDSRIRREILDWFSQRENFRWLLVFDNHDDPDSFNIKEYYPSVSQGAIVVTSRLPDRLNGSVITLKSMKMEQDGLRILKTRSGRSNIETGNYVRARK